MSEFKYACPVCGQHMMCDSSHGGSVMVCPTCFQKITAPQAPASADPKFILTGTKFDDKKSPAAPVHPSVAAKAAAAAAAAGAKPVPKKTFPLMLVVVLALVLAAAGAGVFVFRGKIFKSGGSSAPTNAVVSAVVPAPAPAPAPAPKPEPPPASAPPANDSNWKLDLATAVIPDAPVAGRIHGQNFICERAGFQGSALTLRAGTKGQMEFGVMINFGGANAATLAGKTLHVAPSADKAAKVILRWKDSSGTVQKTSHDDGYAMRLEFGALANNQLPGKIYLCTPDVEKSYLMGTFTADVIKPKPKAKGIKK